MKYNARKAISVLLMLIISCSFFAACDNSGNNNDGGSTVPLPDGYVVINEFESYREDFQVLDLIGYFGKVDQNFDARYVKSGNASAKLTPEGNEATARKFLTLRQYMRITKDGQFEDFSKVKSVSVDAYNASSFDVDMKLMLRFDKIEAPSVNYTLKAGQWNKVIMTVQDYWGYGVNFEKCDSINFIFDSPESADLVPEIYIDDLALIIDQNKQLPSLDIELDGPYTDPVTGETVYELSDFEKLYQFHTVAVCPDNKNRPDIYPKLSINTDLRYTDGVGMSLKVEAPHSTGKDGSSGWPGFEFNPKLLEASFISQATKGWYFTFRVFNASSKRNEVIVNYGIRNVSRMYNHAIYVEAGQWATYRLSLDTVNDNAITGSLDMLNKLEIVWEEFLETEDRVYYFDSFRIVKPATL